VEEQPVEAELPAEQTPEASSVSEDASPAPVAAEAEPAAVAAQAEAPAEAAPARPGKKAAQAEPAPPPVVPGADLVVDIVPEGVDPLASETSYGYGEDDAGDEVAEVEVIEEIVSVEPIEEVAIDLAAGARYHATGKRKTAIARVILRPGSGTYVINGRKLEEFFPRDTLQRNIRQPLETVGYEDKMDVIARLQGGGVSAQAGALRHGISRALLEADPNLRGELKRRGFLTRDARAKERKKAGLKKARKRPQFSKR
jgi:small subunit ribosomal protein S9